MSVEKAAVLRQLDEAWQELRQVIGSLSDEEMLEPGVVEGWSVKDLLGHVAFWAEKAAIDLKTVAAGREGDVEVPDSEQAIDEWNAREAAARKDKSLTDLRQEWERSHAAARSALEAFPEEKLEVEAKGTPTYFRFGGDTFAHYKEHAAQIRAWQQELETTEA